MVIWQPLSWVPPRLSPSVPPWLWPRPPMLFGRRDLLAEQVASVAIRCRSCGRMTPVVRARVCRSCGSDAMAMLVRSSRRLRVDPDRMAGPLRLDERLSARVDEATDRHIAEAIRDAHAFGEVTIGRPDVGLNHDAARLAMFRRERGTR